MIYLPGKFLFIHIPRSAGTSITQALHKAFPQAIVDDLYRKHDWHGQLKCLVNSHGDDWEKLPKIAVSRNPVDLMASAWEHAKTFYTRHQTKPIWVTEYWWNTVMRCQQYQDFRSYVVCEWLHSTRPLALGGFWTTWIGDTPNITRLRFSHLQEDWDQWCKQFDMKCDYLERANMNPKGSDVIDPELRTLIQNYCSGDLL